MKAFQKLALVSAIALTSSAFALEAADDETLAATTGQDGITILVSPGIRDEATLTTGLGVTQATWDAIDLVDATGAAVAGGDGFVKGLSITQVYVHDDDGLATAATTRNSGALVIGGGAAGAGAAAIAADSTVVFADNDPLNPIIIDIDTVGDSNGSTAGGGAMLNVKITTPTLAIKTGAIYVANSNAAEDDYDADGATGGALVDADTLDTDGTDITNASKVKIANGMELILGATSINVQLGNEEQTLFGGALAATNPNVMISVNATLDGGLTINNLELLDQGGALAGGGIRASSMKLTNAGGGDLDAVVGVNVEDSIGGDTNGGLIVTLGRLGATLTSGVDLTLNDNQLGSATAPDLGDVQILGLNLNGTSLIIRGH